MKTKARPRSSSEVVAPPKDDDVSAYAKAVCDGHVIAGPHVRAACARHLRDIDEQADRGIRWEYADAEWVFEFFETVLRLTGGEHEDTPFRLQGWQKFIIGSLFGWRRGNHRRFRTAFIETGKGSGKSPLAAGVGLHMLVGDDEPRAEVYAAATDKEQAGILFRDAVAMVKMSDLSDSIVMSGGEGREFNIAYLEKGSYFRPISSEARGRGKSGFRPHCVLLDEIHEHPTNAMVEFMRAGTKGRRQALIFMITNSGFDRTSVCYEYHEYGAKVCKGEIEDDSFFAYICGVDEDDDPLYDEPDPELGYPRSWAKANPSIGITFPPRYLEEQVQAAKGMPSKESIVRRLNFCEWVDAENPWIDGDLWRACEVDDIERKKLLAIALDLSSKRDLTSMAAIYEGDGCLEGECFFWTPKDTITEREIKDRVPYSTWVKQGFLNEVPGRAIDYGFVGKFLGDLIAEQMPVNGLTFDQWRIEDFMRALDNLGVDSWLWEGGENETGDGLRMVRHGQGYGGGASPHTLWMPRSINDLEERILNGTFKVKRNPVLTWNSASAVIESDATGNKKWEKRKSTGRIDGIVALCMGVGLAVREMSDGGSAYEKEGLLVF